jgi:hypothetical protein
MHGMFDMANDLFKQRIAPASLDHHLLMRKTLDGLKRYDGEYDGDNNLIVCYLTGLGVPLGVAIEFSKDAYMLMDRCIKQYAPNFNYTLDKDQIEIVSEGIFCYLHLWIGDNCDIVRSSKDNIAD